MQHNYLLAFLIGSSWPVSIRFLQAVNENTNKSFGYTQYSMIAPFYFGLMNMLSLSLQRNKNLTNTERFLYITFISMLTVTIVGLLSNPYSFTTINEWISYWVRLFVGHFTSLFIIVQLLEKSVGLI